MATQPMKKSFEFRMSKKVAELTQVVHLLFMRNHEKEIELAATKDAYEYEIDLVIEDAKGQIEKLTHRLEEKDKQEQEYRKQQDQGLKEKILILEKTLRDEREEFKNVSDLLVTSQKDLEILRSLRAEKLLEIEEKKKEIDQLKAHVSDLERLNRYKDTQSSQHSDSLRKSNDKLSEDVSQLKLQLNSSENIKETLSILNRRLEEEVKTLKREVAKIMKSQESEREKRRRSSDASNSSSSLNLYEREIEELKKEIVKYRMELKNREINFNRRFSEMQPIVLNKRHNSRNTTSSSSVSSVLSRSVADNELTTGRVKLLQPAVPFQNSSQQIFIQEIAMTDQEINRYLYPTVSTENQISNRPTSAFNRPSSSTNNQHLPKMENKLDVRMPQLSKPQPSQLLLLSKKSH